jgi:hypothetical protein
MQGPGYSELAMRNQFSTWRGYLGGGMPRAA